MHANGLYRIFNFKMYLFPANKNDELMFYTLCTRWFSLPSCKSYFHANANRLSSSSSLKHSKNELRDLKASEKTQEEDSE